MNGTLDDLYLTWLYEQVGDVKVRSSSRKYWSLFRQLLSTEFVWLIPNDDNRVADGLALRYEFLSGHTVDEDDIDPHWLGLECSFLEMMVGLVRRLSFEDGGEPRTWFWHLIENLGLENCTDRSRYSQEEVNDVLMRVVLRTYDPDGRGGLFPLKNPDEDQRDVELWYQLNAYLLEDA